MFYIGSLVAKLHPVSQGNLSPNFHYFKIFIKSIQDYPFKNQNNSPRFLNPTRTSHNITRTFLTDLESSQEHPKCLRETKP